MEEGTIKINKGIVLWIVIALLFLAVLYVTFKAGNRDATGAVVQSAASAVKSSAPAMVGGC